MNQWRELKKAWQSLGEEHILTVGLDWVVIVKQTVKSTENFESLRDEGRRSGSMEKVVSDAEAREDGRMKRREDGTHSRGGTMGEQHKSKVMAVEILRLLQRPMRTLA